MLQQIFLDFNKVWSMASLEGDKKYSLLGATVTLIHATSAIDDLNSDLSWSNLRRWRTCERRKKLIHNAWPMFCSS